MIMSKRALAAALGGLALLGAGYAAGAASAPTPKGYMIAEATVTVVGLDERRDVLPGLVVEVLDSFGSAAAQEEPVTADDVDLAAAS